MNGNDSGLRMTPAAVRALADGDIANFLVAATPGGIEAQEKAGQQMLVGSTLLPKEIRGVTWEQLAEIGFVRGEDHDDLFVNVTLPAGWTKRATSHDMWSDLLDEQGRKRAAIFYKAAFYDRHTDMAFIGRYTYGTQPTIPEDYESLREGVVTCDGEVIWRTADKAGRADYKAWDAIEAEARAYVETHWPDYRNALAYW